MLTACYGYCSSRKCTDYTSDRTTSIGEPRLQTTRETQRRFGALDQASQRNTAGSNRRRRTHCRGFRQVFFTVETTTSFVPLKEAPVIAKQVIINLASVTSEQIKNSIASDLSKTCRLDHAPTWFVKQYRQFLSPFAALLFNESIITECFSAKYKYAVVALLSKRSSQDVNLLKS